MKGTFLGRQFLELTHKLQLSTYIRFPILGKESTSCVHDFECFDSQRFVNKKQTFFYMDGKGEFEKMDPKPYTLWVMALEKYHYVWKCELLIE